MDFNLNNFIEKAVHCFAAEKGMEEIWEPPLAAVIPADHPLVSILRTVSPGHLLPGEILPEAKSIISFFVPFKNSIIESNLKGEAASEEWAKAYIMTNLLLAYINDETEKFLELHGFRTGKTKATHNFDEQTLMSRWSHRHIAHISGLGTFGINNMLITEKGCCGRFGSLVTDAACDELGFPAGNFISAQREKCLNKINGSCGLCRKKCVGGAYGNDGFDRHKCYAICLKNAELYKDMGLADVCGKCLVGLPCSTKDPSF